MGSKNQSNYQPLTMAEMDSLKIWKSSLFQTEAVPLLDKFQGLFQTQRFNVTWRLLSVSAFLSFIGGALYFLVPFLLHEEEKGFRSILYMTLAEIPAIFILFLLIDVQVIGRITLYLWALMYTTLGLLFVWYFEESVLVFGLAAQKFGYRFQACIITPIYTESYSTVYRAVGLAFLGSAGKLTSAIAPFIIFDIYNENNYRPFLIFGLLSLIPFISMYSFPIEKTGKELDAKDVVYSALPTDSNSENNIGNINIGPDTPYITRQTNQSTSNIEQEQQKEEIILEKEEILEDQEKDYEETKKEK